MSSIERVSAEVAVDFVGVNDLTPSNVSSISVAAVLVLRFLTRPPLSSSQ